MKKEFPIYGIDTMCKVEETMPLSLRVLSNDNLRFAYNEGFPKRLSKCSICGKPTMKIPMAILEKSGGESPFEEMSIRRTGIFKKRYFMLEPDCTDTSSNHFWKRKNEIELTKDEALAIIMGYKDKNKIKVRTLEEQGIK